MHSVVHCCCVGRYPTKDLRRYLLHHRIQHGRPGAGVHLSPRLLEAKELFACWVWGSSSVLHASTCPAWFGMTLAHALANVSCVALTGRSTCFRLLSLICRAASSICLRWRLLARSLRVSRSNPQSTVSVHDVKREVSISDCSSAETLAWSSLAVLCMPAWSSHGYTAIPLTSLTRPGRSTPIVIGPGSPSSSLLSWQLLGGAAWMAASMKSIGST